MDSKTALVILERVKSAQSKQADAMTPIIHPNDDRVLPGKSRLDLFGENFREGNELGGEATGTLGGGATGGTLGLMLANRTKAKGAKRKAIQGAGLIGGGLLGGFAGRRGGKALGTAVGDAGIEELKSLLGDQPDDAILRGVPRVDVLKRGLSMGGEGTGSAVGTLSGGATGGLLGLALANRSKSKGVKRRMLQGAGIAGVGLLGALAGRAAGGFVGEATGADEGVRKGYQAMKQANLDPQLEAFSNAFQGMAAKQLKSDSWGDVANVGLAGLGVGAAGRGLVGLIQHLRSKPKKTRSGPAYLPLPFPAVSEKTGSFMRGDDAATKSGIPWYGPAMMLGGLGSLALGWKGMDKIIDKQRQKSMDDELQDARGEFHDALLAQYDKPVVTHPELMKKKANDDVMVKVGEALDALYAKFVTAMYSQDKPRTKTAVDFSNLAGQATGGYGMYAGLTGLLSGALVYDKMSKRSRRAVLETALKKRQRRRFMQQPTEIYTQTEPMPVPTEQ